MTEQAQIKQIVYQAQTKKKNLQIYSLTCWIYTTLSKYFSERYDSSCCFGYKLRNIALLIREAFKLSAHLLRKRFMANLC